MAIGLLGYHRDHDHCRFSDIHREDFLFFDPLALDQCLQLFGIKKSPTLIDIKYLQTTP
jgi:hypothetical protein